jgi:hypothetical protein
MQLIRGLPPVNARVTVSLTPGNLLRQFSKRLCKYQLWVPLIHIVRSTTH